MGKIPVVTGICFPEGVTGFDGWEIWPAAARAATARTRASVSLFMVRFLRAEFEPDRRPAFSNPRISARFGVSVGAVPRTSEPAAPVYASVIIAASIENIESYSFSGNPLRVNVEAFLN